MIISGSFLNEEKEDRKIKAIFNIQIGEYQLRNFKLIEGKNKEGNTNLYLQMPTYMVTDENGKIKTNEEGKPYNKYAIIVNPELSNKKEVQKELEDILINIYNENKGKTPQINKEIEAPNLEKGSINVSNTWVLNSNQNKNMDYQLKSTNNLHIGAFRVNGVNLIYNAMKNDYNIIAPKYNTVKNGEQVKNEFFIPKNKNAYALVKDLLQTTYKVKNNALKEQFKKANLEKEKIEAKTKSEQTIQTETESNTQTLK